MARLGSRSVRCTFVGLLGPPFEGYREFDVEVDGEPWHVKVSDSKFGFAPRLSDGIDAERLYEWDIVGRGRGERKASYNISPRLPNMRHWETGDPVNLPWENQVAETLSTRAVRFAVESEVTVTTKGER